MQLSAGKEYFLANYFNFEEYIGFVYCGGGQIIGTSREVPQCYEIDDLKVVNVGFATGIIPVNADVRIRFN